MNRKHEPKNDFFYSFVMFAMFAVVVFSVAAEFIDRHPEASFVDTNEALEAREMAANADAHDLCSSARELEVEMDREGPTSQWRSHPLVWLPAYRCVNDNVRNAARPRAPAASAA